MRQANLRAMYLSQLPCSCDPDDRSKQKDEVDKGQDDYGGHGSPPSTRLDSPYRQGSPNSSNKGKLVEEARMHRTDLGR
jgi:hypothetical protein